jgi:hypothetical protein
MTNINVKEIKCFYVVCTNFDDKYLTKKILLHERGIEMNRLFVLCFLAVLITNTAFAQREAQLKTKEKEIPPLPPYPVR